MIDSAHFWARVLVGDKNECWPWTDAKFHFGHGAVSVDYGHGQDRAHRVAWILTNGPITKGVCVLHRCDNPSCCNPNHLFLGSKTDNAADRQAKNRTARGERSGRHTKPHRTARGERNGRAKVTANIAAAIKARRSAGETLSSLSHEFGIGTSQIHRIASGIAWR